MSLPANFASMSVDELWELHEEISKLLEAKILAKKKMLELRLIRSATCQDRPPKRPPQGRRRLALAFRFSQLATAG